MNAARFDALASTFGARLTRRALSGLFTAVLITVGVVEAETRKRSNPKRRNHHKRGLSARADRVHDDGRKKKKSKKKGKRHTAGGRTGPRGGGGCVPKTCAELAKTCGAWDDGCAGTVDCGDCADPCDGAPCGVVGTVTQTRTGDFSQPVNGNPDSPIMTNDFDSTITWRVDQTGQMFVEGGWTSNTFVDGTCCAPPNASECSWVPYQDWSKVREAYSGPYDGKFLTQLGTLHSDVDGSATRYSENQQNEVCGSGEHFEYEESAQVMNLVPFELGDMRPDYSWAGSSTGSQPHPWGQAYHLEQTWDLRLVTLT